MLVGNAGRDAGNDRARADAVDRDAFAAEIHGEAARQADHAMLGGDIGRVARRRTERFPALSEVDFAVQAGISVNTLRKVEGSTANPSFFVVDDLARTLGLDLNEVARVAREDQ